MIPTQVEYFQKLQVGNLAGNTFDEVVVNVQRLKAVKVADGDVDFDEPVLGEVGGDHVAEIKVGGQLGGIGFDLLGREDQLARLLPFLQRTFDLTDDVALMMMKLMMKMMIIGRMMRMMMFGKDGMERI